MGFPSDICEQVLVACRRSCCICNKFCGSKIELHHIVQKADGGADTFENCIPLCFDCHAEVKAYNPKHPKGKKFSDKELKGHRDNWYRKVEEGKTGERANPSYIVNSYNQTGGVTAGKVEINIPEPCVRINQQNMVQIGNEYVTTIDLVIESVYPLSNLYLAAFAPTIIKMTVSPCRTGMFCTGHSGVREGMAFTNIPNFKGNLQIKITTKENEHISIEYNTE